MQPCKPRILAVAAIHLLLTTRRDAGISREYLRMLFKLADAPAGAFPNVRIPIELLQYVRHACMQHWLRSLVLLE